MKKSVIEFAGKEYTFIFSKNRDEWPDLIKRLSNRPDDYVYGVDIETAALPVHKADKWAALSPFTSQPRLLQIATESTCVVFDLTGPNAKLDLNWDNHTDPNNMKIVMKGLSYFKEFLETKIWTAHYAVFELGFFSRYVITMRPDVHCTNIMGKLLLHASRPTDSQSLSLEGLSLSELSVELAKGNQTSDWSAPLTWEQIIYAGMDAIATRELYFNMLARIQAKKLDRIYTLVRKCQWPVVKMQLEGISVNEKQYKKNISKWSAELVKARNNLCDNFGFKKLTSAAFAKWLEENLDVQTLAIWPRTLGGKDGKNKKLKTDSNAFSQFGHLEVVAPIALYQKFDKLLSTYGQSLLDLRSVVSGKLHTRFNLLGARTGRLSSSEPNFQNFPRDEDIRSAFIPDGDDCFVVADYSQIEVRVAAEYSGDPSLLKVYREGLDIYRYTASAITGRNYKSITKAERQLGKALLLGSLYGIGAAKFGLYAKKGYGVDLTIDESRDHLKVLKNTYPKYYYEWQRDQAESAQEPPHIVTTKLGKKTKLDKDKTYGTAINHPIQGTSAEIMMLALCFVQAEIDKGAKCKLVSNIHDEIVISCSRQNALDNAKLLNDNMVKAFKFIFPNGITRDLVGVGIGNTWAAAKSDENQVDLKSVHSS